MTQDEIESFALSNSARSASRDKQHLLQPVQPMTSNCTATALITKSLDNLLGESCQFCVIGVPYYMQNRKSIPFPTLIVSALKTASVRHCRHLLRP